MMKYSQLLLIIIGFAIFVSCSKSDISGIYKGTITLIDAKSKDSLPIKTEIILNQKGKVIKGLLKLLGKEEVELEIENGLFKGDEIVFIASNKMGVGLADEIRIEFNGKIDGKLLHGNLKLIAKKIEYKGWPPEVVHRTESMKGTLNVKRE